MKPISSILLVSRLTLIAKLSRVSNFKYLGNTVVVIVVVVVVVVVVIVVLVLVVVVRTKTSKTEFCYNITKV